MRDLCLESSPSIHENDLSQNAGRLNSPDCLKETAPRIVLNNESDSQENTINSSMKKKTTNSRLGFLRQDPDMYKVAPLPSIEKNKRKIELSQEDIEIEKSDVVV